MKLLNEREINLVTGALCVCLTTKNYNASDPPSGDLYSTLSVVSFTRCAVMCCFDFQYFVFSNEKTATVKLQEDVEDKTTWHKCSSEAAQTIMDPKN